MAFNAAAPLLLLLAGAGLSGAARAVVNGRHGGFLSLRSDLQPQAVALTLASVEQDWRNDAAAFVRCNATKGREECEETTGHFRTSCGTVVGAMVKASSGRPSVVREYLEEVCAQSSLDGWRGEACQSLTSAVLSVMSPNAYANREDIDVAIPCQSFWHKFCANEAVRLEKELAEEQAEEKRRAEATEKLRQADQEAALAKAEAQRRSEAEAVAKKVKQAAKDAEEKAKQAALHRRAEADKALEDLSEQAKDQMEQAGQEMVKAQGAIEESSLRPRPAAVVASSTSVLAATANASNSSVMAPPLSPNTTKE